MQVFDFGKFSNIMNPDGIRIELWEANDWVLIRKSGQKIFSQRLEDSIRTKSSLRLRLGASRGVW
jgi:hypothetical protein